MRWVKRLFGWPRVRMYVNELIQLCTKVDENYRLMTRDEAREFQTKLEVRIREIGQKLNDTGGEELMLKVHAEVASRCQYGRYLEGVWDGIGDWMG